MSISDMRFSMPMAPRERVIDPCASLVFPHVGTALIMWVRRRLESQVIRQTGRRLDSFLTVSCLLHGTPSQDWRESLGFW